MTVTSLLFLFSQLSLSLGGRVEHLLVTWDYYTGLSFGENLDGKGRATGTEFQARLARLFVAGRMVEAPISPSDSSVSFEMQLAAGEANLQSWVFGALDGEDRRAPAYFIRAEYTGP